MTNHYFGQTSLFIKQSYFTLHLICIFRPANVYDKYLSCSHETTEYICDKNLENVLKPLEENSMLAIR